MSPPEGDLSERSLVDIRRAEEHERNQQRRLETLEKKSHDAELERAGLRAADKDVESLTKTIEETRGWVKELQGKMIERETEHAVQKALTEKAEKDAEDSKAESRQSKWVAAITSAIATLGSGAGAIYTFTHAAPEAAKVVGGG